MMRLQYRRLKAENPSAIVCFEVNEFIHVAGERDVGICRQLLNLPMERYDESDPFLKIFKMDDARWPVAQHASNAELLLKAGFKVIVIQPSTYSAE